MVTAEFAVALPSFVLVAVMAIGGLVAITDELRCSDAAATAARLAARGEPAEVVRAAALRAAPRGATVEISTASETVTATVVDRLSASSLFGRLPALTLRQRSVAALEPGASVARP